MAEIPEYAAGHDCNVFVCLRLKVMSKMLDTFCHFLFGRKSNAIRQNSSYPLALKFEHWKENNLQPISCLNLDSEDKHRLLALYGENLPRKPHK